MIIKNNHQSQPYVCGLGFGCLATENLKMSIYTFFDIVFFLLFEFGLFNFSIHHVLHLVNDLLKEAAFV